MSTRTQRRLRKKQQQREDSKFTAGLTGLQRFVHLGLQNGTITVADVQDMCAAFIGERFIFKPIDVEPVPEGDVVRLFHHDWVDDDFNPTGSVEGFVTLDPEHPEGRFYTGAFWNGEQDCWDTIQCLPTHWYPIMPTAVPPIVTSNT